MMVLHQCTLLPPEVNSVIVFGYQIVVKRVHYNWFITFLSVQGMLMC